MRREIDLQEYTDGRLYQANDMVKIGCDDCSGCSACCRDMEALLLDPYDIHQLKKGLGTDFQTLLDQSISIRQMEGLLLPVMDTARSQGHCYYLNEQGRCSIHAFRPGICRLFPLGRYYHDGTFSYILQIHECKKALQSKCKIRRWLGIPDLRSYERYILSWHDLLVEIREQLPYLEEGQSRILNLYLLRSFFQADYGEDFYTDFDRRLLAARRDLAL